MKIMNSTTTEPDNPQRVDSLPLSTQFPFMQLPRELQLSILERSTLISSDRHFPRFCWSSEFGFSLRRHSVHWTRPEDLKRRQPRGFFAVSHYFRQLAQEVFWSRNDFQICRNGQHNDPTGRQHWMFNESQVLESMTRYASTEFFTRIVPPAFISKLRGLYLYDFFKVGSAFRETTRDEWRECLARILSAGLHVQYVAIWTIGNEGSEWDHIKSMTTAQQWYFIRDYISRWIWPLDDTHPPSGISDHLHIEIQGPFEYPDAFYIMHRQNTVNRRPDISRGLEDALQNPDAHVLDRVWNFTMPDGAEDVWIETIIVQDYYSDY